MQSTAKEIKEIMDRRKYLLVQYATEDYNNYVDRVNAKYNLNLRRITVENRNDAEAKNLIKITRLISECSYTASREVIKLENLK